MKISIIYASNIKIICQHVRTTISACGCRPEPIQSQMVSYLVYEGLEEDGRPLADQEALSSMLEAVGQRAQEVLEKLAALGLILKERLL